MATVTELVSLFAEWTGTRPAEGRIRARHLREAGLLPSAGRGRAGAHVNAIHCANYLIGFLAAERTINGPEAVRFFSRTIPHQLHGQASDLTLELQRSILPSMDSEGLSKESGADRILIMPDRTFGEAVALLIEWTRTGLGNGIIARNVAAIRCGRHWPSASIEFRGPNNLIIQQDYRPSPITGQEHRMEFLHWQAETLSYVARIETETKISGSMLMCLGQLCGELERDYEHISEITF